MGASSDLDRTSRDMPALRHNYLRTLRKASDATRPICEKVHCLESMAKFLALFNSIDEKTQFILKFGDDRDLVEFAILTPFASLEELAEGLESFFLQNVSLKNMLEPEPRGLPPFTGLLSKNEDYFDNNFDGGVKKGLLKSMPDSSAQHAVGWELESSEGDNATTVADSTVGSESLFSQGDELEEATSLTGFETLFDGQAQEREEESIQDKKHDDDDNPTSGHATDPLGAENSESDKVLRGIGAGVMASIDEQERVQGELAGNGGDLDDFPGSDDEHAITVRQNYAHWEELPKRRPSINKEVTALISGVGKIGLTLEETKFHCITQGCPGQGSSQLRLHVGVDKTIDRWRFGSRLNYTIDYDSFVKKNRSITDARDALVSLQTALAIWNNLNIGVEFHFVDPGTAPVIFQLEYEEYPQCAPVNIRNSVLAMSFLPAELEGNRRPFPLYIFGLSFEAQLRQHMMGTFLHEAAHILGGRHEDAATAEDEPSVLLGVPNKLSVLVTNRHPSNISIHELDIEWFRSFMRLPEGWKINGYPIRDITP